MRTSASNRCVEPLLVAGRERLTGGLSLPALAHLRDRQAPEKDLAVQGGLLVPSVGIASVSGRGPRWGA